ncbi:hypothetical protein [Sulfurimonas sp.]|uniref:hypothetical protein n=1 Tax=Sulfurimonas sp. TaxID=2022749 RepID=UPI0025F782A0|nr:hypothetical protein [Sulfurimonas sp.]
MSYALIGGLLLNVGAFLTFKGKVYEAVLVYLFADVCWVIMAYERDDFYGMMSILLGVTFGLLAFLKMKSGKMNKNLNHEINDK